MHFTGVQRGPQGVFPTHDPEGHPLPEYRGMWHRPFCCLPVGAFVLIVGCILLSQVKRVDQTIAVWDAATNSTVWSTTFGSSTSRRMPYVGMIIAGALVVAGSIAAVVGSKLWGERSLRRWEQEHPEAAAALASRGGYDAIPLVPFELARQQNSYEPECQQNSYEPECQQNSFEPARQQNSNSKLTAVVRVMVMPRPDVAAVPSHPTLPSTHLHQAPQLPNGATVLQDGNLFHPQPGRPEQPQQTPVTTTTKVAAGETYFYKPQFHGQRLTCEQMFGVRPGDMPGGALHPHCPLMIPQEQKPPIIICGSEPMQQQHYGGSSTSSSRSSSTELMHHQQRYGNISSSRSSSSGSSVRMQHLDASYS